MRRQCLMFSAWWIALLAGAGLMAGCVGIRPPRNVKPMDRVLLTTGYCKCGQCCGWRRTWFGTPVIAAGPSKGKRKAVGVTASGARAKRGTVAADTDVYPFGTVVQVKGYGYGRVEDRGRDVRGDHIDLYFNTHRQAMAWGKRWLRVRIWVAPRR